MQVPWRPSLTRQDLPSRLVFSPGVGVGGLGCSCVVGVCVVHTALLRARRARFLSVYGDLSFDKFAPREGFETTLVATKHRRRTDIAPLHPHQPIIRRKRLRQGLICKDMGCCSSSSQILPPAESKELTASASAGQTATSPTNGEAAQSSSAPPVKERAFGRRMSKSSIEESENAVGDMVEMRKKRRRSSGFLLQSGISWSVTSGARDASFSYKNKRKDSVCSTSSNSSDGGHRRGGSEPRKTQQRTGAATSVLGAARALDADGDAPAASSYSVLTAGAAVGEFQTRSVDGSE